MNAVSLLSRVAQQGAGTVVDCPVFGIGIAFPGVRVLSQVVSKGEVVDPVRTALEYNV
jgi:hypothetical protein